MMSTALASLLLMREKVGSGDWPNKAHRSRAENVLVLQSYLDLSDYNYLAIICNVFLEIWKLILQAH